MRCKAFFIRSSWALFFPKHGLIDPLVEAGKFIKDVTFLAGDFILHEDEALVAMEDLREFWFP